MDVRTLNQIVKEDPSFRGGQYHCVYERNCPLEMMITEPGILLMVGQELNTNKLPNSEKTKIFKILVKGKDQQVKYDNQSDIASSVANSIVNSNANVDSIKQNSSRPSGLEAGSNPDILRFEVLSEYDYFFQYVFEIDLFKFAELKEKQELKTDFAGFQTMLIKLVQNCIIDPEHYKCVMVMNSDSTANVSFFQLLEFKRLNLLELELVMGEEEEINAHASFRFKLKNLQLQESQQKLQQIVEVLKRCNPSLISQINKAKPSKTSDEMAGYNFIKTMGPPSQRSYKSIKSRAFSQNTYQMK